MVAKSCVSWVLPSQRPSRKVFLCADKVCCVGACKGDVSEGSLQCHARAHALQPRTAGQRGLKSASPVIKAKPVDALEGDGLAVGHNLAPRRAERCPT